MNRRTFLQNAAAGAVALNSLPALAVEASQSAAKNQSRRGRSLGVVSASKVSTEGHTLLCTVSQRGKQWKVYEDLRTRDGVITFVSSTGTARVLPKTAEAVFAEDGPQYLGLELKDIGMSAARPAGGQAAGERRSRGGRGEAGRSAHGLGAPRGWAWVSSALEHFCGNARMQ